MNSVPSAEARSSFHHYPAGVSCRYQRIVASVDIRFPSMGPVKVQAVIPHQIKAALASVPRRVDTKTGQLGEARTCCMMRMGISNTRACTHTASFYRCYRVALTRGSLVMPLNAQQDDRGDNRRIWSVIRRDSRLSFSAQPLSYCVCVIPQLGMGTGFDTELHSHLHTQYRAVSRYYVDCHNDRSVPIQTA